MPIRTYTKARVQSRDAETPTRNDRIIYIFPARFSSPSSTGPLKSRTGVRGCVWVKGEGSGCQIRNASELTSRFDATRTLRPIIRSLPPFFGFHAHCAPDPCTAENAHRVFTRLSVLARFVVHFWCCNACRNRRYTIERHRCLDLLIVLYAFNSLPRQLTEITISHVFRDRW